jgi:hypothetical protein
MLRVALKHRCISVCWQRTTVSSGPQAVAAPPPLPPPELMVSPRWSWLSLRHLPCRDQWCVCRHGVLVSWCVVLVGVVF